MNKKTEAHHTRKEDDPCHFLNRPSFGEGGGDREAEKLPQQHPPESM